ncbi:saccharopine dehydrogenase [Phlyctema vagabunda]|uniref:Saccharopine dehydrogenase n=1 Tax=Phlyctema vagabunda TaxID=108571 RepID=A0ABR4P766_9HELO
MSSTRQYDIVLYGATGYTGKKTAEQIALQLPTDLKWALAGRTASKLEAVVAECKLLNPDRVQPAIEICDLDDAGLDALAKKTQILLSTVGPYALYGEHAFKACAENGTHYFDVTGEVPWVAAMIKKYEKTAKANGAIMIPQIGIDSAPADLVTLKLVDFIRQKFSAPTGEVIVSLHELSAKPSGGTLNTIFTLLDVFSFGELKAAHAPFGLSPIPGPKPRVSTSWIQKLLGIRVVPDLGILTTSIGGVSDIPIVQRSWGLNGNYGPNFQVSEMMKARNYLQGAMIHFSLALGSLLLVLPFFRQTARKYVYAPGDGPTKSETKNDRVEYRGIAKPDVDTPNAPRAYCRVAYEGSLYEFTGLSLALAALTVLRDNHSNLTGGVYTPASLGQKFVDRLDSAGFKFETKLLEH